MANGYFLVASYTLNHENWSGRLPTPRLDLRSSGATAAFTFHDISPQYPLGYIYWYAGWGHVLFVYRRMTDFAGLYDFVRSEQPLSVAYRYDDPPLTTQDGDRRTLTYVNVSTYRLEPPGEGPADRSA